ncbi:hypothetical protein JW962_01010 [Candidatus Dojkabacteria bacterium]|nr:hypothetical protein [Candidatus Dojkabacteria bacterium]
MQTFQHNKNLVNQAIAFSQQLLESTESSDDIPLTNIHQYMSRYIICEKDDELWVIDQHAAAERIRFEELLNAYEHIDSTTSQKLLVPIKLSFTKPESIIVESVLPLLQKIGFTVDLSNETLIITAVPETLKSGNITEIIKELIAFTEDQNVLENYVKNKYEDIIATFACHTSLRANQQITNPDAKSFVRKLLLCKNPYSCPHGRPILWKITPDEIDSHFDRT